MDRFFIAFSLGLLASACGPNKVQECNALIDVINKNVVNVEKNTSEDPKSVLALADSMDQVASEAAKVPLKISELIKFNGEYQMMARDVAKAARELSAAVGANDQARIAAAQAAMDKIVKQEDPLVANINRFCGAQ